MRDIHNIRDRIADTGHLFYRELIGGLALPLIYDLFYFHARNRTPIFSTDRSMYVIKELMALLESGRSRKYREVAKGLPEITGSEMIHRCRHLP